jgi:Cd2+/Zn2+-exporting ATPase
LKLQQLKATPKNHSTFFKIYTPIIAMAVLVTVPVFIFHLDFDMAAITLLVIACPCMVISTPVAIYAAIGNASVKGPLREVNTSSPWQT